MHLFVAQVALKRAVCSVQQELGTLIPMVEQKRLCPEQIASHHFTLSDCAAAYETFADRKPGTGKVILTAGA
jgi:threonine dehydrogenase-like Zn-dependent dehydrogenase